MSDNMCEMSNEQLLVLTAKHFVGTREDPKKDNSGELIVLFQKAVDQKAEGESWCMAFAQYCIMEVEKAKQVKSRIFKSEHCLTVWNKSPKEMRLKEPEVGCLIIWQFGDTSNGHVGIVTKVNKNTVETIEGNTGDGSGVIRNGDGVYARKRSKLGSDKMKVLGYLKAF